MRRRPLHVKLILPALTEATSPFWRPIKYSLFPPLGLATLAAYLDPGDDAVIVDEHVERLDTDDRPDLVVIQVYITNAYRAYRLADAYRAARRLRRARRPARDVAARRSGAATPTRSFSAPASRRFRSSSPTSAPGARRRVYRSTTGRTLDARAADSPRSDRPAPLPRAELDRRHARLPAALRLLLQGRVLRRAAARSTRSASTTALAEIDRLPGRHLYFLDDHLLGDRRFGRALFDGMRGMSRLFQGAATVDSILRDDLIERAADAGLRSLFVGFETLTPANLARSNKRQNLGRDYRRSPSRLHDLGIMINGSFVFGMDDDDDDVFQRTVDWAIEQGITTATFHIQTPYPGTRLFARMEPQGRIVTRDWDLYDTRHVVYRPARLTPRALEARLRLGLPRVLPLVVDRAGLAVARLAQAPGQALLLCGGLEEIRGGVEPGDSRAPAAPMTPLLEAVLARITASDPTVRSQAIPARPETLSDQLPVQAAARYIQGSSAVGP